ncbi:uroporphyrinogen-III synthase [Teredinibacter sp. KSP-S5-2]|uniref:uroporphyrinogen-III synthase n=1 Tax=Teredinibacter sp. KSP-S5-2 TaxID=3034506 RepID=UPI002934B7B9|nr:uroporphyrinogen-III synthase [Teredinibacter sp. KSP-S5-2]WNO09326.1 uroporphyrinogen-III synthase [Teredinibacter sp. KSP-S5-2]
MSALGCDIVDVPLLEISPFTGGPQVQAIKNCVMSLDEYAHLIFVSQNAVEIAFSWIDEYWPQLPLGLCFYAVGKKTADCIAEKIQSSNGRIVYADRTMTSEDLLACPELHHVAGQKVMLFRGQGGRPVLTETLSDRGAAVTLCELYERKLPCAAQACISNVFVDKQTRHIVPIFSGEALQNFVTLVKNIENINVLDLTIIVPSERVKQIAQTYFKQVITAANAGEDAMYQSILQHVSANPRDINA